MKSKEIHTLIKNDEIEKAIALLVKVNATVDQSQLLILNNQWKSLRNNYIVGKLTEEAYAARKAKFLESLLWLVDPDAMSIGKIIQELEELRAENIELNKEISFYRDQEDNYNNYRFEELFEILSQPTVQLNYNQLHQFPIGRSELEVDADKEWNLNLIELLLVTRKDIDGQRYFPKTFFINYFDVIIDCGIIEFKSMLTDKVTPEFTKAGRKFIIELVKQEIYNNVLDEK